MESLSRRISMLPVIGPGVPVCGCVVQKALRPELVCGYDLFVLRTCLLRCYPLLAAAELVPTLVCRTPGLFALATAYSGLLTGGVADFAINAALKKCSGGLGPTLVKAVLCNWLVCMAVFLASSAKDLTGKMVGIWQRREWFIHRAIGTILSGERG